MKKKQRSLSIPGISLLLLIFLALCLITFSLLSLSGASADEKLSQKGAERTSSYYEASNRANAILAQTDDYLVKFFREAQESADPIASYLESCKKLPDFIPDYNSEDSSFSFSVPVTDDQILLVGLDLAYPEHDDDPLYHIHTWKIVNTGDWTPDTKPNLYNPDHLAGN